jgi:hypothetical protein
MDLKLYSWTFKVGKCITKTFFLKKIIEKKFDYKSKYIAYINYNKSFFLPTQKVITKIMNYNNQILSSITLFFCEMVFYLFLLKWSLNHNFFIPPCLLEICHIMIQHHM